MCRKPGLDLRGMSGSTARLYGITVHHTLTTRTRCSNEIECSYHDPIALRRTRPATPTAYGVRAGAEHSAGQEGGSGRKERRRRKRAGGGRMENA
eukprot:1909696-Prymnesium_polylepis.1